MPVVRILPQQPPIYPSTAALPSIETLGAEAIVINPAPPAIYLFDGTTWNLAAGGASTTVTSVTGTTRQITASPTTGAVVLSTPQNLDTAATLQFALMGLGSAVVTSSILSLTSTTLGFLMPRLTTTQRDAIVTPATGLQIYNSTTSDVEFYNGAAWVGASGSGVISVAGTTNRITVSGSTGAVTINIAATYVGQSSITTLGTIATGVWQGTVIDSAYGGTGVNNTALTITLSSGAVGKVLASDSSGNATWQALSGLAPTSITGTANQVIASASVGAVTLSLPQSLAISSALQFGTLGLGSAIVASSILSLTSTVAGFLPSRMTTTQKNAIVSAATGLVVYDSTLNDLQFFNGTAWVGSSLSGVTSLQGTASQILVGGTSGSPQTGALTLTFPSSVQMTKLGVGVAALNTLDVSGNMAIGASYAGISAAPSNGLLVQGQTIFKGTTSFIGASVEIQGADRISFSLSGTKTVTDGSSQVGLFLNPTYAPVSTTTVVSQCTSYPQFNPPTGVVITNAYGWYLQSGGQGGAGSITNSYNLYVDNPGFGSTKTCAYFNGATTVNGTSSLLGTTLVNTSTQDGASKLTVAESISITTSRADGFTLIGYNETSNAGIVRFVTANSSATNACALQLIKSRGTIASPSTPLSGDLLAVVDMGGYTTGGAGSYNAAGIVLSASAAQNWTSGQAGTDFNISVTNIGTTGNSLAFTVSANGNVVCGGNNGAAVSTSAVNGFFWIASCAGVPSGTVTTYTGRNALTWNSTQKNFYIYDGGWISKFAGGVKYKTTATKTSAYTALVDDSAVPVDTTTGAVTITLPTAASCGIGATFVIFDKVGTAAVNNVTVARGGSDTINGLLSAIITNVYGSLLLISDGVSAWNIMAKA